MSTETAIHITLNGEPAEAAADSNVADLLREQGMNPDEPKGIAVAVNDEVVRKSDWTSTTLSSGDRVEVITARQGG